MLLSVYLSVRASISIVSLSLSPVPSKKKKRKEKENERHRQENVRIAERSVLTNSNGSCPWSACLTSAEYSLCLLPWRRENAFLRCGTTEVDRDQQPQR